MFFRSTVFLSLCKTNVFTFQHSFHELWHMYCVKLRFKNHARNSSIFPRVIIIRAYLRDFLITNLYWNDTTIKLSYRIKKLHLIFHIKSLYTFHSRSYNLPVIWTTGSSIYKKNLYTISHIISEQTHTRRKKNHAATFQPDSGKKSFFPKKYLLPRTCTLYYSHIHTHTHTLQLGAKKQKRQESCATRSRR